jgi:hypothetical protein
MLTGAERDHINRKITTVEHAALMRRTIRLTCPLCQHTRLFDAVGLWWHCQHGGWGQQLADVARRFYCESCWRTRCSSQRARYIVTDEKPDDGKQFDYPPESVWKKLVSRYRS